MIKHKHIQISFLYMVLVIITVQWLISCSKQAILFSGKPYLITNGEILYVSGLMSVNEETILDKEVVILPGAYITTSYGAKIFFKNRLTIVGQSHVFDENVNIEFEKGALNSLNPVWFGANGLDDLDDTKSVQKVFQLAAESGNALEIDIPIGKYYISKQILIKTPAYNKIPLHISGSSWSSSGFDGSSFIWRGDSLQSMFLMKDLSQAVIENIDFNAMPGSYLKSDLELRPYINQISFRNCLFGGCAGNNSSNINLNKGNNLQVSEIMFDNCIFRGVFSENKWTDHAVDGGWANTKNFHFTHCAIGPYRTQAINITTSDVLIVEGCTFFLNDIDISCETCKTTAIGNYSEESKAFFSATASANYNATTLINNEFTGRPSQGYVIRDGSGTLVLLNNNFGAGNNLDDYNLVRWEENEFNSIYSVGNVYKNATQSIGPFYNRNNKPYNPERVLSRGDLGGILGSGRIKLKDSSKQD